MIMANVREFDELNIIDYETYFDEMDLSEQEKRKRIKLAEDFEILFLYLFVSIEELQDPVLTVKEKYQEIATRYLGTSETPAYIADQASRIAEETVKVTKEHEGQEFYTSKDRAMLISANQANTIGNYSQQIEAVKMGKRFKVWNNMKDKYVRHTHVLADNQKVDLFEPFKVGSSLLMFPTDLSLGASLSETANCRCTIKYE